MDTSHATTTAHADQQVRERLTQTLQDIVGDADSLLKAAHDSGSAHYTAARDKLEQRLSRARLELEDLQDTALRKAKHAAHVTDVAVHDHPYAAMGVAGGVGVLLGLLIARR